jgi:hypothetical protein
MSEENVALARHIVDAFNQRDLAATTARFDSEIEWTPGGPAAVESPVYRGLNEVSGALAAGWETWELFRLEEGEVRDLGDLALWLGRARLRGSASHVEIDQEFAVHFLMARGAVIRMHGFLSWPEALEAAGLSE